MSGRFRRAVIHSGSPSSRLHHGRSAAELPAMPATYPPKAHRDHVHRVPELGPGTAPEPGDDVRHVKGSRSTK